jgi:two-component system, chemotaxis family, protein-glutamate methylesterase/glutaminase
MSKIRVLIVEDSAVVQELLRRVIGADPRLEVAAAFSTAEEALAALDRVAPDVISMDIRLPGMQGLEATRRVMSVRPTPIVVVSGVEAEDQNLSMEALKAGALAVVEKPAAATHLEYQALASRLCTQLAIMSEVRVLRQRSYSAPLSARPEPQAGPGSYRLVGIASSTGGPGALMELLGALGTDFPLPIVVVQHMTPGFVNGFGCWLAGVSRLPVELVTGRKLLEAGTVYLAAGNRHVAADVCSAWADDAAPVENHRPSGDVLFRSLAKNLGPAAIGVQLTGMGEDGARGLLDLRQAGGYTIAEHESSAVVYGMPAAAVRAGAVLESLPVGRIGPRLRELACQERWH